jgi:hypothetical protein
MIEGQSPMLSDCDIYAAANVMVKRFGEDAATQAAMRADEFGAANNIDGQRAWVRIMKAINQLQRARAPDEAVN